MSDWTKERINQQRDLAVAGRAGFWILLEGGPRHGTRGFVPHLDWPFFVLLDAQGAVWSFANPAGEMKIPAGARIVGVYVFDPERENMIWQGTDLCRPRGLRHRAAAQRALARALPNARIAEYEQSGHFLYLGQSERFARDVSDFFHERP